MRHHLIATALSLSVSGLAMTGYAFAQMQNSPPAMPNMATSDHGMAMPSTTGSLHVNSPRNGETITTTDIPVRVAVTNFRLSRTHVGLPDTPSVGHIHVMLDGMNMGVLFNFYTAPRFTLPGDAIAPGPHTLIFDLASNTHMDFPNSMQKVEINYQPSRLKTAPAAAASTSAPALEIASPADGATVSPKFTLQVRPANFTPSLGLEGKPNLAGYGHYHVFVDMAPVSHDMSSKMMSMAGMVGMPGSNTIPIDLSAWKKGKHTITVMPVQDDHTPIMGVKPAMITIDLEGAART